MSKFLDVIGYRNIKYCVDLVQSVCEHFWIKLISTLLFIGFTYLFDTVHLKIMFSLLVLIIVDFITGVWAAKVSGIKIESHKIARSAIKILVYFSMVALGRISEDSLHLPIIDETIITFLTATELYSNLENINKMGYPVPINLIKKLKIFKDKK